MNDEFTHWLITDAGSLQINGIWQIGIVLALVAIAIGFAVKIARSDDD